MSASARRSDKARHRSWSRLTARRASSETGCRGGGTATTQPARNEATARSALLLRRLRPLTLGSPQLFPSVVGLLAHAGGGRIQLERLLPGGEGILLEAVLGVGVTQVLEDHGVFLGLLDGALQLPERFDIAPLLVIGPAEAVDEIAIFGFEVDGLADELNGLVEVLATLGVHVPDVVVSLGVLGIEADHAAERLDSVLELLLLLVDHAELKQEVLLLVVERRAL